MATGGVAPSGSVAPTQQQTMQVLQLRHAVNAGASWFIWVAGLSMVNSVLSVSGGGFRFFGLGATQIVDALAHRAGQSGVILDLIINDLVAGLFVLFWHFARNGQKWAFLIGMTLYALDGLILIPFADYLGLAFHAYALWRIYGGFKSRLAGRGASTCDVGRRRRNQSQIGVVWSRAIRDLLSFRAAIHRSFLHAPSAARNLHLGHWGKMLQNNELLGGEAL
jgi:hypothetical protein